MNLPFKSLDEISLRARLGELDHHMGRNYLAHSTGDAINAMLAAVGYNFRRLIQWLRLLMLKILIAASFAAQLKSRRARASVRGQR